MFINGDKFMLVTNDFDIYYHSRSIWADIYKNFTVGILKNPHLLNHNLGGKII